MRRGASLLRNVSFANGLLPGLGMYPLRGYSYSHVCTRAPCTCTVPEIMPDTDVPLIILTGI